MLAKKVPGAHVPRNWNFRYFYLDNNSSNSKIYFVYFETFSMSIFIVEQFFYEHLFYKGKCSTKFNALSFRHPHP